MTGTVLQVVDAGSVLLVTVDCGASVGIAEVAVDPRCMAVLVNGAALLSPADLMGRRVEVGEDGQTLRVCEPWEETAAGAAVACPRCGSARVRRTTPEELRDLSAHWSCEECGAFTPGPAEGCRWRCATCGNWLLSGAEVRGHWALHNIGHSVFVSWPDGRLHHQTTEGLHPRAWTPADVPAARYAALPVYPSPQGGSA